MAARDDLKSWIDKYVGKIAHSSGGRWAVALDDWTIVVESRWGRGNERMVVTITIDDFLNSIGIDPDSANLTKPQLWAAVQGNEYWMAKVQQWQNEGLV